MATMDLQIFGTSAPQNGLPGGDSARVTSGRSGAESFANAFQSAAAERKKINKKQIDSEAQSGSKKDGLALKNGLQADQHSGTQTSHPAPDANDKALGRAINPAVEVDENGNSLPPSARQTLPSSAAEGHLASVSPQLSTSVSGSNGEIDPPRLDESIARHEPGQAANEGPSIIVLNRRDVDITEAIASTAQNDKISAEGGRSVVHGSIGDSAPILVQKPVALDQALASANSPATDLEPSPILGLNVALGAKGLGLGETVYQTLDDGAVLLKSEPTSLASGAQIARSGKRVPAAAGMNLQSAPTALAELDLGRMTKVALDPQQHANQTALRAEALTTTNSRASGWSDGVRQQLERARFAAVIPQAKQTATVDSIARLPMVESLLSSLGQQTSPGAKLGVEPASLSSVKAGTQGLDQALLTQNGLQQSVTQAVSKGSQSLNPLYQGTVNARIEQTAWMAQIANHAKMAIKDDFRSVEIRLKPAHLGTIEILVSQDDEQTQLAFFTKHAQVREALEGQMPRLQKLFEEDGLKLGDAWVSDQSLAEHREHQTGADRDQDTLTPPGFALDQRNAQVVGSMTAQKADSSAMLDVWA